MREQRLAEVDRVFLQQYNLPELINKLTGLYDMHGNDVVMEVYHEDDKSYISLKFFKLKDVYTQEEVLAQFKEDFHKKYPELAKRIIP